MTLVLRVRSDLADQPEETEVLEQEKQAREGTAFSSMFFLLRRSHKTTGSALRSTEIYRQYDGLHVIN